LILAAAARCPRRRQAVVYGSGWLHDVPLDELSRLFGEVVLVDLFHPLSVRRLVRRYPNVRLVARDVTLTLDLVAGLVALEGSDLPHVVLAGPIDEPDRDLTVSLNLLSQLPCLPENYLRRWGGMPDEKIHAYCKNLILEHLAYLRAAPGVVALITDVSVRRLSRAGRELSRTDTLFGVELPWRGETWDWALVPREEVLTVVGIADVKDTKTA
jgi:hypothetical protein